MKSLNEIAEYVQNKLLEQGFIIHRYDAYSTNSIYLKLDYGVAHSIRISDHQGYGHLSYRYNINNKYRFGGWCKDRNNMWRYNCPANDKEIDRLISIILANKIEKKTFYDYDKLMEKYILESKDKTGFWQKAKEVKLDNE